MLGYVFPLTFGNVARTICTMKYIDAHCHLVSGADMAAAANAGVVGRVINAACEDDWAAVVNMTDAARGVYVALGIHPWYVADAVPGWDARLRDILVRRPDLMVGETGLDKNRGDISPQADFLRTHLRIAADLHRVVHIHSVGAWGALTDVLRDAPRAPAVVMHAFSGSVEMMRELARYNAYFSFGGLVLDSNRHGLADVVAHVDAHCILVETDAPDSGFPAADLARVVERIAAIRGVGPDEMAEIIYQNSKRMLHNG